MPLAAFPKCFVDAICVDRTMTVDQWIDQSGTLDLDGLEFYWPFTPWRSPEELRRLRGRVEAQGRSIPMLCYSPDFTRPEAGARREEIEGQKRAIAACAEMGGRFCRVLSGQRRPGLERKAGLRSVQGCIAEVIPFAERHRVTLVLENHYKDGFWSFPEFAQKMDVFLELLEGIGRSPWFGVNYDPSNAIIAGDDPLALLEAVKDRVVTMHASDRFFEGGTLDDLRKLDADPHGGYAHLVRHGTIGRGLNDYDRIFATLKGAGFRGWISIEDGSDPTTGLADIAESTRFLRAKMKQHGLE